MQRFWRKSFQTNKRKGLRDNQSRNQAITMHKLSFDNRKEDLADRILKVIELKPNAFSSRELSLLLGVSQNRVCEALARLEKDGMIACRTTKRLRFWNRTSKTREELEKEESVSVWNGGKPKKVR